MFFFYYLKRVKKLFLNIDNKSIERRQYEIKI